MSIIDTQYLDIPGHIPLSYRQKDSPACVNASADVRAQDMIHDAIVRGRTREEIEIGAVETALLLECESAIPRDLYRLAGGGFSLLDKHFRFEVVPDHTMPGLEGQSLFKPVGIRVPERVGRALRANQPRARFTVSHELGHVILHPYQEFNRHVPEEMRRRNLPPQMSAEWQANQFAAAFLMPKAVCWKFRSPDELASACIVSVEAARNRLTDLGILQEAGEMTDRILRNLEEIRCNAQRR